MLNLIVDYVTYLLDDGFISNWLVAGPQAMALNSDVGPDFEDGPGIGGTPVERGPLESGVFQAGAETGVWAYHACPAVHFVDHSGTYPTHSYLRSWAYAEIVSDTRQAVSLELATYGPAGVCPLARAFRIQLDQAVTPVLVRFERRACGVCSRRRGSCGPPPRSSSRSCR